MRRVGIALIVAGALLWLAMLVAPFPKDAHSLFADVRASGSLPADRIVLAVADGAFHSYDEANDTTFVFVARCSHSLCGAVASLKGDYRSADLSGPILLDPVDDELSLVAAPPPDPAAASGALNGIREGSGTEQAYSSYFEPRSAWPIFLPRLAALGLVAVGIGLAARPRWPSILPGALAATVGIVVARQPMAIILAQIAVIPLALAMIVTAIVAAVRKRAGWGAAAILLFGAAMLAASFLAFFHFPPGEDA